MDIRIQEDRLSLIQHPKMRRDAYNYLISIRTLRAFEVELELKRWA